MKIRNAERNILSVLIPKLHDVSPVNEPVESGLDNIANNCIYVGI